MDLVNQCIGTDKGAKAKGNEYCMASPISYARKIHKSCDGIMYVINNTSY